jgi:hypothetical protein
MPLQATSGAASQDGFGGNGVPVVPNYIEEVFSTYLYTGNSSTQTITNGIDLSTNGGLVWLKQRSAAGGGSGAFNVLSDTARGIINTLCSSSTAAQNLVSNKAVNSVSSTGFVLANNADTNLSSQPYVSWTFRKQPKFFDVVTYTGTGANRTIAHSLGSVPGCMIIKSSSAAGTQWIVYHRSLGATSYVLLNSTAASASSVNIFNNTAPTSAVFTVGVSSQTNGSGDSYVAYLFAHDAGGFGLTGTDNVISCGTFTTDGSENATVNLGYEPQWLLVKPSATVGDWAIFDNMRGWNQSTDRFLNPNTSGDESNGERGTPTATGFNYANNGASTAFIYVACRRGPMKVPTTGTSVFAPVARTGTGATASITAGFPVDLIIDSSRVGGSGSWSNFVDRLRGNLARLTSVNTNAEQSMSGWNAITGFDSNTVVPVGSDPNGLINSVNNWANWMFRRAPSFMDVVCYTGTAAARTINHNLGIAPELMIFKSRSNSGTNYRWPVFASPRGSSEAAYLDSVDEFNSAFGGPFWNSTSPTASVFSLGTNQQVNGSGATYVAYLFATCAGVSKVFSYTGNGSSQTINCGFTAGSRWIMIKRTDSTGDWYVWDSARGIIAGNDPHLSLNTTAAEVTTDDSVDTDNTGFIVNQLAATNINVTSATYIGIAIA